MKSRVRTIYLFVRMATTKLKCSQRACQRQGLLFVVLMMGAIATGTIAAFSIQSTFDRELHHHARISNHYRRRSSALKAVATSTHNACIQFLVDPRDILNETSIAHLNKLLKERCQARYICDYDTADYLLQQIQSFPSHLTGYSIRVTDTPRDICNNDNNNSQSQTNSYWSLLYSPVVTSMDMKSENKSAAATAAADDAISQPTVLHLAHAALGMAVSASNRGKPIPVQQRQKLVDTAKHQLQQWARIQDKLDKATAAPSATTTTMRKNQHDNSNVLMVDYTLLQDLLHNSSPSDLAQWIQVEGNLQGRKSADAAFWFALSGTSDIELFHLLTKYCIKELKRFGRRPSCRAKDVWDIAQRMAAAGVCDDDLERVIQHCLQTKVADNGASPLEKDVETALNLHSDRCTLMLWEFSTRQRKQRSFLTKAANHWQSRRDRSDNDFCSVIDASTNQQPSLSDMFADPSRPLVVDVGCGMGVCLLGLASLAMNNDTTNEFSWSGCNFLGVDLNAVAISYAQSISKRWELQDRLVFIVDSAENALKELQATYPGPIVRILVQFPTPYRLPTDGEGNSQLPTSVTDGFMVTSTLIKLAHSTLSGEGEFLIQSNCEDVAIWVQSMASQNGFVAVEFEHHVVKSSPTPTQRTVIWTAITDGAAERAVGLRWSALPLLPRNAMTETEVACLLQGTPVHRCILVP